MKKHCKSLEHNLEKHSDHHLQMIHDFKVRLLISLILTLPIVVMSPMIQEFFDYSFILSYNAYILWVLSSFVFFYGGWPFLKGLYQEAHSKNLGMMTLIGLAVTVSYLYSVSVVFGMQGHEFFWELVTLIDIMLLGHWIEMKSVLGASRSLTLLVKLMPRIAHRIRDDKIKEIKIEDIKVNDIILIKPGEKIPADGSHYRRFKLRG